MSIQMKEIQFPEVNYDHWKEEAIKALKGKPFESLHTKTIDGVTLKPLYTQEMLVDELGEQLEKQIATIRSLKAQEGFKLAQQIYGDSPSHFFENLKDGIHKGNDVIFIDSHAISFEWDDENLTILAQFLSENSFKISIQNIQDPILKVFDKINDKNITGYIVGDEPISLPEFPGVKTLCLNTVHYHYEGANAVQELAIALAKAAQILEQENVDEDFASKFFVNFAMDTQFFAEVAKIRAFKVLWKAFASAYTAKEPIAIPVIGETSLRSFSTLDHYVNLLRAGNQGFSALIGGVDVFTVHPHDCLTKTTDKSIRIARNVSLVIKEESRVEEVLDPAGGSYFIESLTAEFVEKAWDLFIEIQDAGGFNAYVESGKLQSSIEEVYNSRLKAVETRKHSLIGTNIYANPADELPQQLNSRFDYVKRLAIPFERLRTNYAKVQPKIGILTYGNLKDFKPRADFVAGFFATAGVIPAQSGEIQTVEEAKKWLKESSFNYVIIAAKDDDAKQIIPEILAHKPQNLLVDVAGKYKEEEQQWLADGLNGFIYAGQNIVEKLTEVLEGVKGVQQ